MFKISFDFCSPDTNCRQLIIGKEITIFESHSFPKINNLAISSSLNGYTPRGSRCIVAFIRLSILICLQLILKWSSALEDKLVQRSKFTWCETVPRYQSKLQKDAIQLGLLICIFTARIYTSNSLLNNYQKTLKHSFIFLTDTNLTWYDINMNLRPKIASTFLVRRNNSTPKHYSNQNLSMILNFGQLRSHLIIALLINGVVD